MPIYDAHAFLTRTPYSGDMADAAAVRQTMAWHSVDRIALVSGLAASGDVTTGNAELASIVDPANGVYGYVCMSTGYPDEAEAEQSKYLLKAAFVAGYLVGAGRSTPSLAEAQDILSAHRRYTKPVAVPTPNAAAVDAVREMAAAFPTMRFLMLGMGGEDWRMAVHAARHHVNVFLELSGVPDADKVSVAMATLGPRRLLFGSGLPHGSPQAGYALIEEARSVPSFDRARIYEHNAQALFHANGE